MAVTMEAQIHWQAWLLALTLFVLALSLHYPSTVSAQISASAINFPAHASSDLGLAGIQLSGVLYKPSGYDSIVTDNTYSAVVMMHGCGGMWSNGDTTAVNGNNHFALPNAPNLQNNVEKWGIKLAQLGIVALAVDSYTRRKLLTKYADEVRYPANEWQRQCAADMLSSASAV